MARADRTRSASRADARAFLDKTDEFLDAARLAAATGLAVHAGISDADSVIAARLASARHPPTTVP